MPVAKHLAYARSRSRMERPRRIDALSSAYTSLQHDEVSRAQHESSSQRPEIAQTPAAPRSIIRSAAFCAETVGETIFIVAAWLLSAILDGCAAYALAMYGIPAAINDEQPDEAPKLCDSPTHPSRPALHLISTVVEADNGACETFSPADVQPCAYANSAALSGQMAGVCSSWRMALIAPTVLLLSKIGERSARRRAVAELRRMDDRMLRDIGISRTDIGYLARHGVRRE